MHQATAEMVLREIDQLISGRSPGKKFTAWRVVLPEGNLMPDDETWHSYVGQEFCCFMDIPPAARFDCIPLCPYTRVHWRHVNSYGDMSNRYGR